MRSQVLQKGSFRVCNLASLGEAWWLMPKVGEAGQTGDARQLLLLMGDEGIWIQFQNYGIKRFIHLDSCSVTSSQAPFCCWQPSSWIIPTMKIEENLNLSLSSNSSSQSATSPSTSRTNFLFPRLLLELALPEDQSIQRSLPSARSTCVNSATARVMWAGHGKLFLDRYMLQGQYAQVGKH